MTDLLAIIFDCLYIITEIIVHLIAATIPFFTVNVDEYDVTDALEYDNWKTIEEVRKFIAQNRGIYFHRVGYVSTWGLLQTLQKQKRVVEMPLPKEGCPHTPQHEEMKYRLTQRERRSVQAMLANYARKTEPRTTTANIVVAFFRLF